MAQKTLFAVAALAVSSAAMVFARQAPVPNLVLFNGRVFTLDSGRPWAEAVAIAGSRISAVGSTAEIKALATSATRIIDLKGAFASPGFNDAHVHLVRGAEEIVVFEKIYPHILENADAIAEWTSGTLLVPYMERLPESLREPFMERYRTRLRESYPQTPVFYGFRRTLFSATWGA